MAKSENIRIQGLLGMKANGSKSLLSVDPNTGLTHAYQLVNTSLKYLPNIKPRKIWEIVYKKTTAVTTNFPIEKA